jgi:adenylate cyclase
MEQVASTAALAFPAEAIGRGLTEFFRGNFGEARRLMESFVQDPWGDTAGRPPAEWPLPNDALAAVYGHLVLILWISGERQAAYAMGERGLHRAEDLGFPYSPFTTAYVNSLLALTRRMEGDHRGATTSTQAMLDLAERHGFAFFAVTGMLHRALDRAYAGEAGAIEELRGSVGVWRHVVMGEAYSPWALVGLADAEAAAGHTDEALAALDQALAVAAATGSEFYSAEALRRRGELRAQAGDAGGIADIEKALELARGQEARAFELRAAMALARIPGHSDAGRAAVLRALDGIPPDPANEDLREARSLVEL